MGKISANVRKLSLFRGPAISTEAPDNPLSYSTHVTCIVQSTFGRFLAESLPLTRSILKFQTHNVSAVFSNGLDECLEATLQGVTEFVVDESYAARMFTIIATLELAGKLVGGPVITWLLCGLQ